MATPSHTSPTTETQALARRAHADEMFAEILARDARRLEQIIAVRHKLDSTTLDRSCEIHAALPFEDARQAWLQSWCAWHTEQWSELLEVSGRALRYFELSGETRRVIELHLMRGFAALRLGQHDVHRDELALAQKWLQTTREVLPGAWDDPVPGDLPFLMAMHVGRGHDIRTFHGKVSHDVTRLFEQASHDFRTVQSPGALAMSWREQGSIALEQGDVASAAESLQQALLLDLDQGHDAALTKDLELIATMADALGQRELGSDILDTLIEQGVVSTPSPALHDVAIPNTLDELEALFQEHDGRRQALLTLRSNTRTPSVRSGQADLLALLAEVEDIDAFFSAWSYELVAEVGQAFAERGERELARRYLAQAVVMLERVRRSIGSLHIRQNFMRTWWPHYMALVHQKVGIDTDRLPQRDYQEAAALIGAVKARGLRDVLEGAKVTDYPGYRDIVAREALPPSLAGKRRELFESILHALAMWRMAPSKKLEPAYPLDRLDAFYGADTLAKLVPDGALALEYVLGERTGYVLVVNGSGKMTMRQIAGRREIEPLFEAFKLTLLEPTFSRDEAIRHRELAERLYVALIAPVQDLITDTERLYISPDAMLHDLPFEALARPKERVSSPDYLFLEHTISYVPSLHVWTMLHDTGTIETSNQALLVGAPVLDQPSLDLLALAQDVPGDGLHSMSELFTELPGSARELDAISKELRGLGFEAETLSGEQATEAAVRERAKTSTYALMHIATHGLSDAHPWNAELERSIGMQEPALLLAREGVHDGLWRLEEVLGSTRRARTVVLSGCTTGRGWRALGDGSYGLAGAFLSTGSHTVVASSWSIADDATQELMTHMYKAFDADLDAARALNEGRREWVKRARKRGEPLPPFYWAALRVVGR